ncbi:MAG TPA: FAD-binding oxidoreductase [Burkholderiales bacterium]|jgi:FAD/FMN-containing dehydrogenase
MKDALGAIVGKSNVLTAPEDTKPYFTDWRRQYAAQGECVVRPGITDEVSRVVALCAREGVAVVPQGGNTGLVGGSVPTGARREIVLSLSRMNRVRALDALNDTITVEAGCVLEAVQKAAERAGRLFPLSLAAQGSCQIGGNLSTNAGGVNVLRYGNAREQVLGLEVVLPDGRVWEGLRGLRKDNTGYDLKQLFLGAEGTLGIITAAVLRLYPRPTHTATAWIAVKDAHQAVELLAALRTHVGDCVSAFELVSRTCLEAVLSHVPGTRDPLSKSHPWYVLAEFGDSSPLEDRVAGALEDHDAVLAQSVEQSRQLWRIRESIPEAQFTNVKHDISVPVSKTPEFIERAGLALKKALPEAQPFVFGHVGDGNLHYNVGPPSLMPKRAEVNRIVYDAVDALGGSISAEHGLGQLKRDEIRRHKSAVELELMRTLKKALDPQGLMNPGKLL